MNSPKLASLLLLGSIASAANADCTGENQLYAADLVDTALLSGPTHLVLPCATIVGHMAQFTLQTPHGEISAKSIETLEIRIQELAVLDALASVEFAELAGRAAKEVGVDLANALGNVVMNPKETIQNIPTGLGRYIKKKYNKLKSRAQKYSDKSSDTVTDADDHFDGRSPRPGATVEPGIEKTWWDDSEIKARKLALDYIGYRKARREWARKLGADPYTSNPLLNTRLDELAWAALSGGKSASLAIGAVSGVAGTVISTGRRLNEIVWELDPQQISERNAQELMRIDCDGINVRRFLRNGSFSPTMQIQLVDALVELNTSNSCQPIMHLAGMVSGETDARFITNAVNMMLGREAETLRLTVIDTTPVFRRKNGDFLLLLPLDRMVWNKETKAFFDLPTFRYSQRSVLFRGSADNETQRALTNRGWNMIFLPRPIF